MANRIDDLVDALLDADRLDDLETELARFEPGDLDGEERESWHHTWGIAAFQRGDRDAALARFAAGLEACPESDRIRFSLGQEHEHAGEPGVMIELFDECGFPKVPAAYALAQARYAYLWDRIDRAIDYVLPIVDVYHELKIADDNFLYMRDLPFFGQVWASLGAFWEAAGDLAPLRRFTLESAERLSDYPFESLTDFAEFVASDDPASSTAFVEKLKRIERDRKKAGFASGYNAMQIAVIEAQASRSASKARKALARVRITGDDFPWLEDIRVLAGCDLARRFGEQKRETELQAEFLERQPLLFEPEHAFNFRLVAYQESLKTIYRESKRSG